MTAITQQAAKTEFITDRDDVKYAYWRFGATDSSNLPLVMLPHFHATMDTWGPIIVNTLAQIHPIIFLDFPDVGHSIRGVSSTFVAMATKVINFPLSYQGLSGGSPRLQHRRLHHSDSSLQ